LMTFKPGSLILEFSPNSRAEGSALFYCPWFLLIIFFRYPRL
jgi:hypothetical protein